MIYMIVNELTAIWCNHITKSYLFHYITIKYILGTYLTKAYAILTLVFSQTHGVCRKYSLIYILLRDNYTQ